MTFKYNMEKETKNTIKFYPDLAGEALLGQAALYIQKDALKEMGITKPSEGLTVTIEARAK